MATFEASVKPKLIIHYDILSAYSYLAVHTILNSSLFSKESVDIDFNPVSVRDIFETVGSEGPMNNKYKAAYTSTDFWRLAQRFNLHHGDGLPPAYNGPSTTALRTLHLIKSHHPSSYRASISALYHACWSSHTLFNEVSVLQQTLEPIHGKQTTKELLYLQAGDAAAEELENTMSAAIDSGAFGLPWILG
ncbi:hypothetical protein RUND412_005127 [Rhizina undulata]